jgi:CIC family chloride channel protein
LRQKDRPAHRKFMLKRDVSPQPNVFDRAASLLHPGFWVATVLTGVAAGFGGAALMMILRGVQHTAWSYESGDFLHAVQSVSAGHRMVVLVSAGIVTAGALLLIRKFLRDGPGLSSGIWFHSGRLPLARTFANAILSIVIVGLGASLGREAAPKEVAAAIASSLSDLFGLTNAQRRLLVACGAGAGMAAVYNVPLGGALFAIEVLLGTLALPLVLPALVTSLIATAIAWTVLPMQPSFSIPAYGTNVSEIIWAIVFGPFAGIAAVAFVRVISWASARKPRGVSTMSVSVAVFAIVGIASLAFPQILGNGKNVVQLAFVDQIGPTLIAALLVLKLAATAGCLSTGAPGGLFMPTMAFGALLGGLFGHAWERGWPTQEPGSYAVIGAGALLAAASQGPVSAIVLVLELASNANGLIVPLMLAVAEAVLVARMLESRSIYSGRIASNTPSASRMAQRTVVVSTAFDDLVTHDYSVISAAATFPVALQQLLALRGGTLYVLDERGALVGALEATSVVDAAPQTAGFPLAAITAGDLASNGPFVDTAMTRTEVIEEFNASGQVRLPLVERGSHRLVGIVNRKVTPPSIVVPR